MIRLHFIRTLFLALFILLLSGCGAQRHAQGDAAPKAVFNNTRDTFTLDMENTLFDVTNQFFLEVDSVVSDSRCPKGVECIWEGNAEVRLHLKMNNSATHLLTLNTNPRFAQDTTINHVNFRLLELNPYPVANKKAPYYNYEVKMAVERNKFP